MGRTCVAEEVDYELRRYLFHRPTNKEIKREGGAEKWGKTNGEYFPHLHKVVCKFLSVQATSASSERKSSTAGNILTPKCNRISCEVVDDLVVLHSSRR
ncbi:unnamed protein product, partial [Discosporangium mesarthrocarpum]